MGRRPRNSTPETAAEIASSLATLWPDAVVELDFQNAFQLLCATILAAQSTDKMINTITPALFAKYPTAEALARAEPTSVEPLIFKSGFYRNKAKSLVGMARALVERHGGRVPETMEALVALPGVARKTANVVLGCALGKPSGVIVDTHVTRLSQRLGMTTASDPVDIEQELMKLLPRSEWTLFANRLIWHGRRVCIAKKPLCDQCALAPVCPSAFTPGTAASQAKAPKAPKAPKATAPAKKANGPAKKTANGPAKKPAKPPRRPI
jgi:endonuclease-3